MQISAKVCGRVEWTKLKLEKGSHENGVVSSDNGD